MGLTFPGTPCIWLIQKADDFDTSLVLGRRLFTPLASVYKPGKLSAFSIWTDCQEAQSFGEGNCWTILDYMMPQDCSFLPDCVYPSSDSQSPASSSESYILSPNYLHPSMNNGTISNYLQDPGMSMAYHQAEKSPLTSKRTRCKMIGPQRHSASEREKLRMRNLSTALQNLRRYLPPSVVPAGRNLTKIETLRLTISYISHLSELLGLNEETLEKRRETQPETNAAYPKIPEGYQEVTCRHYQQNPPQSQSPMCNELSYQCNNFRISSTQYNTRQQEEQWISSSVSHRRNIPTTDCRLTSPYTSRFTHTLYQVMSFLFIISSILNAVFYIEFLD